AGIPVRPRSHPADRPRSDADQSGDPHDLRARRLRLRRSADGRQRGPAQEAPRRRSWCTLCGSSRLARPARTLGHSEGHRGLRASTHRCHTGPSHRHARGRQL
ncbi:MAG: Two-component transcriptional response regulator, LuxR family, partial [uncultured Acidimicrobiales bacterium]